MDAEELTRLIQDEFDRYGCLYAAECPAKCRTMAEHLGHVIATAVESQRRIDMEVD